MIGPGNGGGEAARLLSGTRYPANSGGRVDVVLDRYVAQVKHVRRLSLAQLEALALEMQGVGAERGKIGLVVVKRRGGKGYDTPRLVVMTEEVWREFLVTPSPPGGHGPEYGARRAHKHHERRGWPRRPWESVW